MKLSIIIPAYNAAQYIKKCIRSCEQQDISQEKYEVIVVDDGSTDNTKNGIHVYPYKWFDLPGYTNLDDVVCIHRVAQSWNANAGLSTREQTDPKKKTLGYRKMLLQKKLADFIMRL